MSDDRRMWGGGIINYEFQNPSESNLTYFSSISWLSPHLLLVGTSSGFVRSFDVRNLPHSGTQTTEVLPPFDARRWIDHNGAPSRLSAVNMQILDIIVQPASVATDDGFLALLAPEGSVIVLQISKSTNLPSLSYCYHFAGTLSAAERIQKGSGLFLPAKTGWSLLHSTGSPELLHKSWKILDIPTAHASIPTVTADEVSESDIRVSLVMDGLRAPRRGLAGLFVPHCSGQFCGDGSSMARARVLELLGNGSLEVELDEWTMNVRCSLVNPTQTYDYRVQQFPTKISPTLCRYEIKNNIVVLRLKKAPGSGSWAGTLKTKGLN
ncbi:unnamed protein product [Dicrocoelium dendriticum]|nr:unnamed protein product [Dicrocoelium dendriticum]